MAKHPQKTTVHGNADTFHNANRTSVVAESARPSHLVTYLNQTKPDPFNDMGQHDRRFFNPNKVWHAASTTRKAAKLVTKGPHFKNPFKTGLSHQLQFNIPKQVALCIRRRMRKEIMHALKINKSKAGSGRKHRNKYSSVGC